MIPGRDGDELGAKAAGCPDDAGSHGLIRRRGRASLPGMARRMAGRGSSPMSFRSFLTGAVMSLPAGVLQAMAGKRTEVDGKVLDPHIALMAKQAQSAPR